VSFLGFYWHSGSSRHTYDTTHDDMIIPSVLLNCRGLSSNAFEMMFVLPKGVGLVVEWNRVGTTSRLLPQIRWTASSSSSP
jgi:hypothetical protein